MALSGPLVTVWKGTSQDCVDHMRKAHDTPVFVKAGNLARWFPPWTVTREQWYSMNRPSVSGIANDMFLFSRIETPLFHRYRVFDRQGSHPAFRGTAMMAQWLGCRTRNPKVASSSPVTTVSSLGIGSLNHN